MSGIVGQAGTRSGIIPHGGIDYEEGTWTPTITREGAPDTSAGYDAQAGTYLKIGKLVWVSCSLRIDGVTGGSGFWKIEGIPFTGTINYNSCVSTGNYINNVDRIGTSGEEVRWQLNSSTAFFEYSATQQTTHTSGIFIKGFSGCYKAV